MRSAFAPSPPSSPSSSMILQLRRPPTRQSLFPDEPSSPSDHRRALGHHCWTLTSAATSAIRCRVGGFSPSLCFPSFYCNEEVRSRERREGEWPGEGEEGVGRIWVDPNPQPVRQNTARWAPGIEHTHRFFPPSIGCDLDPKQDGEEGYTNRDR